MEPWRRLDLAPRDEARALLHACCGSTHWVERMIGRRPFGSREALQAAAQEEWFALAPEDWREAFAHHPKIGDREALRTRFGTTRRLSMREQAGVDGASEDVLNALAEGNREYEQRFGYLFIICATGRGAGEMLTSLRVRLANDEETEIRVAAAEQARITAVRLDRIDQDGPA